MNCVANHKVGVFENSQLNFISGTKLLKNTPSKKAPKTKVHSKNLRKTAFWRSKFETFSSSCSFCLQQPLKTLKPVFPKAFHSILYHFKIFHQSLCNSESPVFLNTLLVYDYFILSHTSCTLHVSHPQQKVLQMLGCRTPRTSLELKNCKDAELWPSLCFCLILICVDEALVQRKF